MRTVLVIAMNTYRELIRDRVLYGLLVFAVLFIGLSLLLGQLSFDETTRISTDFGLAAIQLCGVILSIFVGSTLVSREIEKKTILTLLARPITRGQFLLGKSLGLLFLNLTVIFGLTAILIAVLLWLGVTMRVNLVYALWGVILESTFLLYLTMLFGLLSKPLLSVSYALGVFLIGHWMNSLGYFSGKADPGLLKVLYKVMSIGFPNLERFNWRSLVLETYQVPLSEVALVSLYDLLWCAILLIVANLIFRRRDFV